MIVLAYGVLVLGVLAIAQGYFALWNGILFRCYVESELTRGPDLFAPRATVFLPCKGKDAQLEATLSAVAAQEYSAYDVICAVESLDDPAREVIERIAATSARVSMQYVVAGRAEGHSQKIANLLAAIARVDVETEVYVFLDSDAVPHSSWLRVLVGSLDQDGVGAATGYRWYVPSGSSASLVRCIWNASTLTFLGNHGRNFCWGGSTAIRRETFERLGIAERWRHVLSDDYEMTRAVRGAGLRIHFAPRCVISTDEPTSWGEFWRFARRQMIITRRCSPKVWTAGAVMGVVFSAAFWGLLAVGLFGSASVSHLAWTELVLIYSLAAANGTLRQRSARRLFPDPALRRGTAWADALAAPLVGLFNLGLIAASAFGRRFWWRGILYDMESNERVIVRLRHRPN